LTWLEMTAMWNLNGNDIQKAKADLEARRAALKAEYEEKSKQIDTELSDIEAVERVAVNFVSGRKGETPAASVEAEPAKPAGKEPSPADSTTEMKTAEKPAENASDKEDKPASDAAPVAQKGSRWRMRLGPLAETEAAD